MERLTRAELIQDHWNFIKFFFVLWLISLYGEIRSAQAEEHYDLTTTTVMVHWFDSETDLQYSLQESDIAGVTECEYRPDFNTSFCEMWLVRPKGETDEYNLDTVGHEFYHALVGDFHDD